MLKIHSIKQGCSLKAVLSNEITSKLVLKCHHVLAKLVINNILRLHYDYIIDTYLQILNRVSEANLILIV